MLENKNIVVTGVTHGIGAETAHTIKAMGARVIGVDIETPSFDLDDFILMDLSNADSIEESAEKINNGIDGLCNIAGLPPTAGWDAVLKVNFLGLRYFTEIVIPKLNNSAAIVNLASLAGSGWPERTDMIKSFIEKANFNNLQTYCKELNLDGAAAYFLSKEVLVCWTIQNRWTWRDRGIRMNCVSPGPVETRILPDFMDTLGERAKAHTKVMDRPGLATDIAPIVSFLLSDASSWIRGANIPVDGGLAAHMAANKYEL